MIRTLLILSVLFTLGCTSQVPPGYLGMRMESGGFDGTVLQPGRHSCWGRCRLFLVESGELTVTEPMSILCRDDLNFKFDLRIRSRIALTDNKGIRAVLDKQGQNIGEDNILRFEQLYKTFVQPIATSVTRNHVSKFSTTEIRENRGALQASIEKEIREKLSGSPVEVTLVVPENFDYPDVITAAVEKRRQREIQIDEEKAKHKMELEKAKNRKLIAEQMKMTRVAEAEAEAAYNLILSKSLTPNYLHLREVEARIMLYERAGAGDKVIVTDGSSAPVMLTR